MAILPAKLGISYRFAYTTYKIFFLHYALGIFREREGIFMFNIDLIPMDTINTEIYDYIRCPITKTKLAWKPKNVKVRVIPISQDMEHMEGLVVTCRKCNKNFLIMIKK